MNRLFCAVAWCVMAAVGPATDDRPCLTATPAEYGIAITSDLPRTVPQKWDVVHGPSTTIVCAAYLDGRVVVWQWPCAIDVNPTPPVPPPIPPTPPTPPTPPVPPAELWGVVVEESAERTPAQAAVLDSAVVRALFPPHRFRIIDDDSKATDAKPFIDAAKGKPRPYAFLVDPAGQVVAEGPLPATVAAMAEWVRGAKQ